MPPLLKSEKTGRSSNLPVAPAEMQGGYMMKRLPGGKDRLSFAGVYLFTLLLYARPNDLFPGFVGSFPITKVVAMATTLVYVVSRSNAGKPLLSHLVELKMVALIAVLAILFMPMAASPQDTMNTLLDDFLKTLLIFLLMINLIDSRERLRSLLKLVFVCNSVLAVDAIQRFKAGEVDNYGRIVGGLVGGLFGNANDLATSLDMVLPLAVALALTSKGFWRFAYSAGALLMATAVLLTLSRGGFLGIVAAGGVLLWKLSRRNRLLLVAAALLFGGGLLVMPRSYGNRLLTIFSPETDNTGSAQVRQLVLQRGVVLALRHAVVGVGMGNFHIYSFHELRAHNSYVEIASELGFWGLIAYLVLMVVPLRSLRRIERETVNPESYCTRENYYLAVALQASLAAYAIDSFFGSYEYSWFLYYTVAYAIALRTIHDLGQTKSAAPSLVLRHAGVLWSHSTEGLISPFAPMRNARTHSVVRQRGMGRK